MKNLVWFVLLGFTLLISCQREGPLPPTATQGRIDLSSWKPETEGNVSLSGTWEFYWRHYWLPGDFEKNVAPGAKDFMHLPDFWNEQTIEGVPAGRFGFATYRLTVALPREMPRMALKIPKVYTAYRVWVNGKEYPGRGKPGTTAENTTAQTFGNTLFLDDIKESAEVLLHVANFNDTWGGPRHPLVLGSREQVIQSDRVAEIFTWVVFGTILMGAIFNFAHFFSRALENFTLFFGLLCLCIALNMILSGDIFLLHLFPNLNWEIENKMEYLSLYFSELFFLFYLKDFFREDASDILLTVAIAVNILLALPVFFFEAKIYTWGLSVFEILVLMTALYGLFVVTKAWKNKRPWAGLSMTGFAVFLLTCCNEILNNNDFVTVTTPYMLSLGLFTFILFQSLVISFRFASSQKETQALSKKLQLYSFELEDKVTERTRELELLHRQKIDFFVKLAHETRNPLTLIMNYFDAFLKKTTMTKELNIIRQNLQKLQSDIVNYLDLEKLNRGQFLFNHDQATNVSSSLRDCFDLFRTTAEKKSVSLVAKGLDDVLFARIDPGALEKIVVNLLDNALKHSPKGSPIEVFAGVRDGRVELRVKDRGPGIPETSHEAIFLPYSPVFSKERSPLGVGVGLSIVKRILEECGGSIVVNSKVGEGAEFVLSLLRWNDVPVEMPPQPVIGSDSSHQPLERFWRSDEKPLLLVVEDHEDLRDFMIKSLSDDYLVVGCRNGLEALEQLQRGLSPHLILSDIMMEGMDGDEFFQRVRSSQAFGNLPFLFISAKATKEDRIRYWKDGAVDTIAKPFTIEELRSKIYSILLLAQRSRKQGLKEAARFIEGQLAGSGVPNNSTPKEGKGTRDDLFDEVCRQYQVTDRQRQIIVLISEGKENKEIASILRISRHTVDRHVQNLYERTRMHNRIELLNLFFREV